MVKTLDLHVANADLTLAICIVLWAMPSLILVKCEPNPLFALPQKEKEQVSEKLGSYKNSRL